MNSVNATGLIHEIFSSIQGEGLLVGRRQIFLRLCGCNLKCEYCDTPLSRSAREYCKAQVDAKGEAAETVPNPVSVERAAEMVVRLHRAGMAQPALAVTGGEPLMQASFLASLLARLREVGIEAMLETNGTLPAELEKVLPWVSRISMDIKLESCAGNPVPLDEHKRFLELSHHCGVFVKIVFCAQTREDEIAEAARLVRAVDPGIVIVLQPVTPTKKIAAGPAEQILRFEDVASHYVRNVRVIPQAHRLLGVR
jgi:7-carboxy-7-deazaguanine synthase